MQKDDKDQAAPDTLVVDLTEIEVVGSVLDDLGIWVTETEKVVEFDLALLKLELGGAVLTDIDPVLAELRARFAGRAAGWSPLIGKNRRMASVFGAYPQTKSMSLWDPVPAEDSLPTFTREAGEGVRIGLLDTRIYEHPALAGLDIETPDPATRFGKDPGTECTVEDGHGVFTAGLILEQAPRATLVARHVLGSDGKAYAWDVIKKLAEFLNDKHPVDLMVLASGCRNTLDGRPPLIVERAMERLSAHMMIVAAAGNHGIVEGMSSDVHTTRNSATWPAALPRVVAVGVAGASYSPQLPWVNCAVHLGEDPRFVSTYLEDDNVKMLDGTTHVDFSKGYASWVGTSSAAAYVGGMVAAKLAASDKKSAYEVLPEVCAGPTVKEFDWQYRDDGSQRILG
ncbi:subtilase family protein [Lentzea atacamensis]|uniref:Subtilase family protein n=1 Tax=Lentzea atacamensis TaxID=531938 RepID=A0A316I9R1_9PSEU|nr:S8/S53 family peptidase [Lentzea atacamensis]PWK87142.1 subtilase family protein [Lentzea atacamensis]